MDDAGEPHPARSFDLPHHFGGGRCVRRQRAVKIRDEQQLVVVLVQQRRGVPPQRQRAAVVAADVHHRAVRPVVGDGVQLLRQGGRVEVGVGVVGADQPDSRARQRIGAVFGTEIGVDDVQVGDQHAVILLPQRHR